MPWFSADLNITTSLSNKPLSLHSSNGQKLVSYSEWCALQSNLSMGSLDMKRPSGTTNMIWKSPCPKKVNIFIWLAWVNNVLTLDKLETRRCYTLPTTTCFSAMQRINQQITCSSSVRCPHTYGILFTQVFNLPEPPMSLQDMWEWW